MSNTFIRACIETRTAGTLWLDTYPFESIYEDPEPTRVDACIIYSGDSLVFEWLRSEFVNMDVDDVALGPNDIGVLGNRDRRGPFDTRGALDTFHEHPHDDFIAFIRGRSRPEGHGDTTDEKFGTIWTSRTDKVVVYECLRHSWAVNRAWEALDVGRRHHDNFEREPVSGTSYTQENAIYDYSEVDFREITDQDELRLGKRPIDLDLAR